MGSAPSRVRTRAPTEPASKRAAVAESDAERAASLAAETASQAAVCSENTALSPLPSPVEMVIGGAADSALLEHILLRLPPEDVLPVSSVSRLFATATSSDGVWRPLCDQLWADKVYVPAEFRECSAMTRREAYMQSLADSRRTAITAEELCSFSWSYRMKGYAGGTWISSDPWHRGEEQIDSRCFHADGTNTGSKDGAPIEKARWHFVPETCGRQGPLGSFVRMSRDGRSYPTHVVTRWPANWGWVLNQCWSIATSFPMPPRGEAPELEDGSELCRAVDVHNTADEAWLYQQGLPLPFDEALMAVGDRWRGLSYEEQMQALLQLLDDLQAEQRQHEEGEEDAEDVEEEEHDFVFAVPSSPQTADGDRDEQNV